MKNLKKISIWIFILGCIAVCFCTLLVSWTYLSFIPAPFYEDIGWVDANYLPLIEPYRAIKLLGEEYTNDWKISLYVPPEEKELDYYLSIQNIQKISVQKNIIMIYSPDSLNVNTTGNFDIPEYYWFVIIPNQNIEIGFKTEEEFLKYIHTLNIKEPLWINPDVAYEEFARTKCLDWIPNCK